VCETFTTYQTCENVDAVNTAYKALMSILLNSKAEKTVSRPYVLLHKLRWHHLQSLQPKDKKHNDVGDDVSEMLTETCDFLSGPFFFFRSLFKYGISEFILSR
jgi:hypothetical protein